MVLAKGQKRMTFAIIISADQYMFDLGYLELRTSSVFIYMKDSTYGQEVHNCLMNSLHVAKGQLSGAGL